jgi:hypothetical protein
MAEEIKIGESIKVFGATGKVVIGGMLVGSTFHPFETKEEEK